MSTDNTYDIVFSFDTTGSMYPCIREVRRNLKSTVKRLFDDIPGIRIGIIAHGDYQDEKDTYLMKQIDLTQDQDSLIAFVDGVGNTCGYDYPEAYEYVLHKAQSLSWDANKMRGLVMIGDAPPHPKNKNPYNLDWRHECGELKNMGINIYSVQCLYGNSESNTFYKQMAELTGGYHLKLDQFSHMSDLMTAVCFQQVGVERVEQYEQEVRERMGGVSNGLRRIFDNLLGRESTIIEQPPTPCTSTTTDTTAEPGVITPCESSKFQVLEVESKCSIKQFVQEMGLTFKTGKGFYEFTKPEIISKKKTNCSDEKRHGNSFRGRWCEKSG